MTAYALLRTSAAGLAERTPQHTTLTGTDAWGDVTTWQVEWLPEIAWGIDLAQENVGRVPVVWADEPPVVVQRHPSMGFVRLVSRPVQVAADLAGVFHAQKVEDDETLTPGTYRILSES